MQLSNRHHVESLRILVRLGAIEFTAIDHLRPGALLESLKLADLSARVDKATANRVGVTRDRADDAHPSALGLLEVWKQQVDQEEMAEVVDAH